MLPPKQITIGATPSGSSWWPAILLIGAGAGVFYLSTRKPDRKAPAVAVRGGPKWYVSYNYLGDDGKVKRSKGDYAFNSRDQAQQWIDDEVTPYEDEQSVRADPSIYSR